MIWNWQQADWAQFRYDKTLLESREAGFLHSAGILVGAVLHLDGEERAGLTVELMSNEALKTSEIEGDILDRDSVQSSIRRQLLEGIEN